jgi:hypothetical protein
VFSTDQRIDVARSWTLALWLLAKQAVCTQDVPVQFQYFKPYQFLFDLMTTTEATDDEQFRSGALLWIQSTKPRDHTQLIPLFVDWKKNSSTKIRLLGFFYLRLIPRAFLNGSRLAARPGISIT